MRKPQINSEWCASLCKVRPRLIVCPIAPPYQNLLGRLVELTSQQHLEGCFEVRIGPILVSECPWEHHRAVRPMVRGVSALSKHIHWPWKANRRVYHSRAGLWSSIFACQVRCFEVRIGPECPWKHHRAVRPMVRGVSALSKHIYWPWKANRRVYHSRAGFWSSIFACQMRCVDVRIGPISVSECPWKHSSCGASDGQRSLSTQQAYTLALESQ